MKRSLAVLALLAALPSAFAQTSSVPSLMSYQGRVSDATGTPIGATSPVNRTVTFKIYNAPDGGVPIYAESQLVTISEGYFSVLLGNGTGVSGLPGPAAPAVPPYIDVGSVMKDSVYLGITVDDGTPAEDAEISPRQQIVSTGFAFRARLAEGLASNSLTTDMLASSSVTTTKILDANVTTAKIADANIVTSKLADGSVTVDKLGNASVSTAKLADASVTTAKLLDANVTTTKLADGAVTSAKIADGSIQSIDIGDGQVQTADLANAAVTAAKLAENSVELSKLVASIQQALCPTGTILSYAGDVPPAGWALCDGASVSRTTYAALFSVIGTRFGSADSSTFRLPDLRGRFLRGRDGGAGQDPDRASRTAMNAGGATGDAVGSVQDDQFRSHTHPYKDVYHSENGGDSSVYLNQRGSGDTDNDNEPYQLDRVTSATGGSETRPKNAYVNYIIKL